MESIHDSPQQRPPVPGPGPSGVHSWNKTLFSKWQARLGSTSADRVAAHRGRANSQVARSEFPEAAGHCHSSATLERAGFLTIQRAQTPHCFQSSPSSKPGPALCVLSGIYVDVDRPAIFNLHLMAQINWLLQYFTSKIDYKCIFRWSEQQKKNSYTCNSFTPDGYCGVSYCQKISAPD